MHPSQILDAHVDLATRLDGWELRDLMAKTASFALEGNTSGPAWDTEIPDRGDQLVYHLRQHLKIAYDYQVTDDMVEVLRHASSALDDDDVIDWTLAPTDAGIVRFERPMRIADVSLQDDDGFILGYNALTADWMVWGPITPDEEGRKRIATYWFLDPMKNDPVSNNFRDSLGEDGTAAEVLARMGQWLWIGCDIHTAGMPLNYGVKTITLDDENGNPVEADLNRLSTGKLLVGLWELLNQTIVETDEPQIERPSRRRAKKMGIPDRVTVIRLRRHVRTDREEGESDVEWSHRWMVRGHWRWQACGTGRAERRRIWVPAYVKGPEDKPLVITDKLYRLER